jgi:PhnB protein
MSYADVFVLPVPQDRKAEYRKLAELGQKVWLGHGALSYVELEADDVKTGKWTSFPQSVDLKDGEYVVISFITYRDRAHRDEVNARAMADPRFAGMDPKTMPFDARRMFWGGFKPFVGQHQAHPPAVQPYLFFRGRCEEAIDYYRKTLGAEVGMMLRFRDNPDKPPRDKVPEALDDRIMHASLVIAGSEIMMSDGMKSGPLDFQCMSLSLAVQSEPEADRLFNALAAEGAIQMPIGPTFFARRFGAVADRFGVSWMIMVPQEV